MENELLDARVSNDASVGITSEASASASPGGAARRYSWLKVWVACTDVLALLGAIGVTWLIRHDSTVWGGSHLLAIPSTIVYLGVFAGFRLYSLSRLSPAEEFRRIIAAVSTSIGFLLVLGFWFRLAPSRLAILLTWVFSLLFTLIFRRAWHQRMGHLRFRGDLAFRPLLVGTNEEAMQLTDSLRSRGLGFQVVGYVPTERCTPAEGLPMYGDLDALRDAITASGADCVFVASTAVTREDMAKITRAVRGLPVEVRVSANISETMTNRLMFQQVSGLVTFSVAPVRLTGAQAAAKRMLDVLLSSIGLVLSLPLWGLIALAIKLDTRGPALYRQERIGQDGRPFQILKFRTMVIDAEAKLDQLRALNEASGPLFKLRRDPRVTRVGGWLRRTSLDELPQLLNVLRGSMSLVGPRPALPSEVALYQDWHMDRLSVKPGVTGLWQVRGRSQLPFDDYVRLDLYYIENWSIPYDLFIMLKTIPAILFSRGAY